MKRLRTLIIWLGLAAYLFFALGFVRERSEELICGNISVRIIDSLNNRFIVAGDIMDILLDNGGKLLGYPLHTVNSMELEKLLLKEPFIKNAVIYKTVDGILHADITQRRPVLRVVNNKGASYYLDREGQILPVTTKFTSRVPVANGYIAEPFVPESTRSIYESDVPRTRRNSVITDLHNLACFIDSSDLWRSQITQIYVNSKYEYELIPRVGAHVIYLGDATNFEQKFRKLDVLYRYGLNNKGWNNYSKINLKYENQVVCTKR